MYCFNSKYHCKTLNLIFLKDIYKENLKEAKQI